MITTKLHINLHRQKLGLPGIVAITQRGKVVGYCESAKLVGCSTWTDQKKALFSRTPGNKRTVHLAVTGTLINVIGFVSLKGREVHITSLSALAYPVMPATRRAHYNPTRGDCGFLVEGEIWSGGKACTVSDSGMLVS